MRKVYRLKQSLNLPKIDARPPCPPRVYSKLFAYLNQALLARIPGSGTPTRKSRNQIEPRTPLRCGDGLVTPRKASAKAKATATPGKRVRAADGDGDKITEDGVPGWVMPLVRHVCRAMDAPAAVPHVYAGVCSVVGLLSALVSTPVRKARGSAAHSSTFEAAAYGEEKGASIETVQIPALVVTVALYTLTRMKSSTEGELDGEMYLAQRRKAVAAVREVEQGRMQSEEDMNTDVEMFVRRAVKQGWLEGEWFGNIPEGGGVEASRDWLDGDGEEQREEGVRDHSDKESGVEQEVWVAARTPLKRRLVSVADDGGGGLQCGLGTMMQDRVDWLSEERRREFMVWKRRVMRRIEEIERTGQEVGNGDKW